MPDDKKKDRLSVSDKGILTWNGEDYDLSEYREARYWQVQPGIGVCYLIRKGRNDYLEEDKLEGLTSVGEYEELDRVAGQFLRG